MIEPLPPALRELVASETGAPVTTAAAQRAVRAKLGITLGIANAAAATAITTSASSATAATTAAGTAAGGTTIAVAAVKSALAIKLITAVVLIGTGAAITTVAVTRDREPAHHASATRAEPARPTPAPPPAAEIPVEPIAGVAPAADEPSPVAEPARKRIKQVAPAARVEPPVERAPAEPGSARSQSQLLADASRSLAVGEAARALELIDEDARAHPSGPLVEEREALRISVLAALGKADEARAAARRLLEQFPHTIHKRLAERTLAQETP